LAQTFTTDAANELTGVTRTGTFTESGATPAPATSVTVNGLAAQTYGDFTFARTNLTLASGNNTFTNIAQNSYGVRATNILSLNLPASVNLNSDGNGNLTNDGTRAFGFDCENQLTNVTLIGQWRSDFVYDGLNRRRIARDFVWQGGAWVLTNEAHYIYDARLLIQERNTNNTPLVTYTRGLDFSGSLQQAGGIGGLLARTDGSGSTFYHADAVGNITTLMDGSENIVARYLYNPYGKLIGKWGTLADANVMRFSSKPGYRDIYDFGYRWYVPDVDRFLNEDPIQEWGGLNLYSYAYNAPADQIDPFGLMPPAVAPAPPTTWGGPYANSPGALGGGAGAAAGAAEIGGAAVAGVAAAGIATAGLVGYDAYQLEKIHELNKQTAEAERYAEQKKQDHDRYHKRCDEPPPTGLTPCELAKWKLQKALDCKKLRDDFADKYYNGAFNKGHQKTMDDLNKTIEYWKAWIDKYCNKGTK
jgi:RHS repeat-associated protein